LRAGRYTSVAMRLPSRVGIMRSVATLRASYCFGEPTQPGGGMRDASAAGSCARRTGGALTNSAASTRSRMDRSMR